MQVEPVEAEATWAGAMAAAEDSGSGEGFWRAAPTEVVAAIIRHLDLVSRTCTAPHVSRHWAKLWRGPVQRPCRARGQFATVRRSLFCSRPFRSYSESNERSALLGWSISDFPTSAQHYTSLVVAGYYSFRIIHKFAFSARTLTCTPHPPSSRPCLPGTPRSAPDRPPATPSSRS